MHIARPRTGLSCRLAGTPKIQLARDSAEKRCTSTYDAALHNRQTRHPQLRVASPERSTSLKVGLRSMRLFWPPEMLVQ